MVNLKSIKEQWEEYSQRHFNNEIEKFSEIQVKEIRKTFYFTYGHVLIHLRDVVSKLNEYDTIKQFETYQSELNKFLDDELIEFEERQKKEKETARVFVVVYSKQYSQDVRYLNSITNAILDKNHIIVAHTKDIELPNWVRDNANLILPVDEWNDAVMEKIHQEVLDYAKKLTTKNTRD